MVWDAEAIDVDQQRSPGSVGLRNPAGGAADGNRMWW
jgi:hypothetical protein